MHYTSVFFAMPWLRNNTKRPFVNIAKRDRFSVHGGQILIEALCRRYKIWDDFPEAQLPNPIGGFSSQAMVAQLLFSFAMGVPILESGDRFRRDPVLLELLGLESAADEATLRAWLEGQTPESVQALRRLNSRMVRQAVVEGGAANNTPASARVLRLVNSKLLPRTVVKAEAEKKEPIAFLPIVLADTKFPMRTPGASGDHPGQSTLSWQTLSIGQFLLDGTWGNEPEDSISRWSRLERLLTTHRESWTEREACFHYGNAPDDPDDPNYRTVVAKAGFAMWTAPADFKTEPATNVFARQSIGGGWKPAEPGDLFADQYAILPLRNDKGTVAAARSKHDADQPENNRYLFMPATLAHQHQRVDGIFQLHNSLKEQPKVADEMLDSFALRILPFDDPIENAAYFALATLAFNLIVAVRDFILPPELREWPIEKIIHEVLLAPVRLSKRGRQRYASIWFPEGWLQPCQKLVAAHFPRPKRGRPPGWRKAIVVKTSGGRRRKRAPNLDPLPDVRPDLAPQAGGVAEDAARREPESF